MTRENSIFWRLNDPDAAVDNAICQLRWQLQSDLDVVEAASLEAAAPDWARLTVVGRFPARFRHCYGPQLVTRLGELATGLSRSWREGRLTVTSLAEFMLVRWVLNQLMHDSRSPADDLARYRFAESLGLVDAPYGSAPGLRGPSDPWGNQWGLESIRVNPNLWFTPAIREPRTECLGPPPSRRLPPARCARSRWQVFAASAGSDSGP